MIKEIKKLKKLGIFDDYKWNAQSLGSFGRYNLLYGYNGSGKTTLSKLFSILQDGFSSEFPDLIYEIDTEDQGVIKNNQKYSKKIRVFNRDYIDNNIETIGSKAKPIFILGEENKIISEQIEKDSKLLEELEKLKKEKEDFVEKKNNERGKQFTDVSKIIGSNTSGSSVRNYRKPDAEKAFSTLEQKELLTEEDLNKYQLTLKSEEKNKINETDEIDFFGKLCEASQKVKELTSKTVEVSIIERLKENPDISEWVEEGLHLHLDKKTEKCEFCNQNLPEQRLEEIISYFNKEDQELKKDLDFNIEVLEQIHEEIKNVIFPDKANLYLEFQSEYTSRIETFNKEKINLQKETFDLIKVLQDKKTRTTEKVEFDIDFKANFNSSIKNINETISKHNNKTTNFQEKRDEAREKLEKHYLSDIFDSIAEIDVEIKENKEEIKKIENGDEEKIGITKLREKISTNKETISSEHKACGLLNNKLEMFLGRKEIIFEVSDKGGYAIKRNGKIANNLSEGEKTAIAFVYFVVHLEDKNFDLKDGIVVVDDPISSLDSNSLFQAFSFLKNSVSDAEQVFILTHNFDFLRLVINWLNFIYRGKKEKEKPYFMIKNKVVSSERIAEIQKIDPLLTKHETEYHFLCSILFDLPNDDTIISVYHIPNVARKVLETFLMFRVPNSDTPYKKLEDLEFDENKKTSIYKFTNDQSHITGKGFDPSLVAETQKNVKYLLEMIKETFQEHYSILEKSIQDSKNI